MRHAGVDAATAAARLALQDRVPEVSAVVTAQLGEEFAGIWWDISTGTITIATTGRPVDFGQFDKDAQLAGHLTQVTVRHSLVELKALSAKLGALAEHVEGVVVAGVSLHANSVLVRLQPDTAPATLPADLASAITSAGDGVSIETLSSPATVHARRGGQASSGDRQV